MYCLARGFWNQGTQLSDAIVIRGGPANLASHRDSLVIFPALAKMTYEANSK